MRESYLILDIRLIRPINPSLGYLEMKESRDFI